MLIGLGTLVAVLWSGYWFAAYSLARSVIGEAAAAEPTNGTLACSNRAFGGFPLWVTVDCRGASAGAGDGVRANLAGVAATAPLYSPGRLTAAATGPFQLDAPSFTVAAAWDKADATLDAGLIAPMGGTAIFDNLAIRMDGAGGAPMWSAHARQWGTEIRPAAGEDGAIQLALLADNLVVTHAAEVFPTLSGTARLRLHDAGSRLDRAPLEIVRTWLAAGGAVTIEHLHLSSGAVNAEATGRLVLNLDGTVSGDVDVRYTGEEDLPALVGAVFPWARGDAGTIAAALIAVSRPVQMNGEPAFEVRLNIRRGMVSFGLFPIVTIPSMGSLAHLL
jgi:hypothetical protein